MTKTKEEKNAISRAWKKANPDKVKAYRAKVDKDKATERNRLWRAANKEQLKAKREEWMNRPGFNYNAYQRERHQLVVDKKQAAADAADDLRNDEIKKNNPELAKLYLGRNLWF